MAREQRAEDTQVKPYPNLKTMGLGLLVTALTGLLGYFGTLAADEVKFYNTLGHRVPAVEVKVVELKTEVNEVKKEMKEALAAQKELDQKQHEEVVALLRRVLRENKEDK